MLKTYCKIAIPAHSLYSSPNIEINLFHLLYETPCSLHCLVIYPSRVQLPGGWMCRVVFVSKPTRLTNWGWPEMWELKSVANCVPDNILPRTHPSVPIDFKTGVMNIILQVMNSSSCFIDIRKLHLVLQLLY